MQVTLAKIPAKDGELATPGILLISSFWHSCEDADLACF